MLTLNEVMKENKILKAKLLIIELENSPCACTSIWYDGKPAEHYICERCKKLDKAYADLVQR